MRRLVGLLMLATALIGCSDDVVEYTISSQAIKRFTATANTLVARDDANSPLAALVLASNQIGAPEGVQVWNLEATLKSVGLNDGDLIALVDGQVPLRNYGLSFAVDQNPFDSPTEQYVRFVSGLLAMREAQNSVLLSVHPQYRTTAERKKYGLHTKEPLLIRIVFQ